MAEPTPVSHPVLNATGAIPSTDGLISPVSSSSTFAHKTSPAVATQTPLINTNTPAINAAPVELDGIPADADILKRRTTGGSTASTGAGPGLAHGEAAGAEILGEHGRVLGKEAQEKRAAMLASRSKDPSVIVDVPQFPTAEEVEAAKSAEGSITPGLPSQAVDGVR